MNRLYATLWVMADFPAQVQVTPRDLAWVGGNTLLFHFCTV